MVNSELMDYIADLEARIMALETSNIDDTDAAWSDFDQDDSSDLGTIDDGWPGTWYHYWWDANSEANVVTSVEVSIPDAPTSDWKAVYVTATINSESSITLATAEATGATELEAIEAAMGNAAGAVNVWVVGTINSDGFLKVRYGCDLYDNRVS